MLVARLTRTTPDRPEADLGVVTITAREHRRGRGGTFGPLHRRFDAHVVTGPGEERTEEHVYVSRWDPAQPAVDLLEHVLAIARHQRTAHAAGVQLVMMDVEDLGFVVQAVDYAIARGFLTPTDEQAAWLAQAHEEIARQAVPS